jgi:cell division ATPase FtsA
MGFLFTKDIAVLDINSRVLGALVGVKKAQSVFEIKARASKEYSAFQDGEWLDAEDTVSAAKEVLTQAMRDASSRTKKIFIGVPAEFLALLCKDITVKLDRRRRVIDADVEYLLKKGDTFDVTKYLTINSSAIYYSIDTSDKLYSDVRGITASQIEAKVSYMLCERSFVAMMDKLAQELGFKEIQYIATPWAESLALFEKEQRDGVFALIDVGFISSSVCIGRGEGLFELKSFSMGGGHIAADIYDVLGVPYALAEQAVALADLNLSYSDTDAIVSDAEYSVLAADACEAVRSRIDIIADIVKDVLDEAGYQAPSYQPVYLTGEGICSIRGAAAYLSERLGLKVEIASPKLPGFAKPADSSAASLLIVSDNLAKDTFRDFIKRSFNGGKN